MLNSTRINTSSHPEILIVSTIDPELLEEVSGWGTPSDDGLTYEVSVKDETYTDMLIAVRAAVAGFDVPHNREALLTLLFLASYSRSLLKNTVRVSTIVKKKYAE